MTPGWIAVVVLVLVVFGVGFAVWAWSDVVDDLARIDPDAYDAPQWDGGRDDD